MTNLDDYEVISVIGNGSFGTCFKVQDKITNKVYAWKVINYDSDNDELEDHNHKKSILDSEIGFLQQLKHPNIVQYYDHITNIETKTIFIIMEYCDGGDLLNLIQKCTKDNLKFEEKYIWKVLYQILKALQLCHNKITEGCILHRDIKPANIFLDKCGNVKLGDFGLARILKRSSNTSHQQQQNFAESFVGSPYYMSPEIVRGRKYNKKSDIWAVGCLIYEMCCLKPPFSGKRFEQLSKNIANGHFNSIPPCYTKDLQEIISFILEVDSEQRPNVEILLRHPVFIRNLNDLKADFPKLLPRTDDVDNVIMNNNNDNASDNQLAAKKLDFSMNSSYDMNMANFTFNDMTNNTFDDTLNHSTGRITGINTPQLRAELFGSSGTIGGGISSMSDLNVTAIYNERIYENSIMTSNIQFDNRDRNRCDDPQLLTRDIFEEALKQRLETIRAQEMLLKQREINLMEKEKQLMDREIRLTILERTLDEKKHHIEGMLKRVSLEKRSTTKRFPKRRISRTLDESYCTIEPNESFAPTVAKLEMSLMPPPSHFLKNNMKKSVTFSSPKKIFKANDENIPPPPAPSIKNLKQIVSSKDNTAAAAIVLNTKVNLNNNFQSSLSSKTSNESENSSGTKSSGSKRRSILSIFGINSNSQKNKNNSSCGKENLKSESDEKQSILSVKSTNQPPEEQLENLNPAKSIEILDKVNSNDISHMWTKENKKAAFEMLAAMNAADKEIDDLKIGTTPCTNFENNDRNSNLRRTTRERGTSLNRSSKLRRSAVYLSQNTSGNRIML